VTQLRGQKAKNQGHQAHYCWDG